MKIPLAVSQRLDEAVEATPFDGFFAKTKDAWEGLREHGLDLLSAVE